MAERDSKSGRSSPIEPLSKSGRSTPQPPQLDVPEARPTRSQSPTHLSTELTLKMRTQMSRLKNLKELMSIIPTKAEDTSEEEVQQMTEQIDNIHMRFLDQHTAFELSWPAHFIDHPYFSDDVHGQESKLMFQVKRALGQLKHQLAQANSSEQGSQEGSSRCHSKLPDISLPGFTGQYTAWPTFRDMFISLVLDNSQLTSVEKLYYLRGSLSGDPLSLISGLPLAGDSLKTSWDLLNKRYENKRLMIQGHLDAMFSISMPAQKDAVSLNRLLTTVSENTKALQSLGMDESMWDCLIVHQVTKNLDSISREQWENSLGSSQEYPRFHQLESFLTTRVRTLERIAASIPQSSAQVTSYKGALKKTAHTASPTPRTPGPILSTHQSLMSNPAPPTQASSTTSYPCDNCQSTSHFIIMCPKFRDLSPQERLKLAIQRQLCFCCLGWHSVRACRSTKTCKKCNKQHHTMLHEAPPTAEHYEHSGHAQPNTSSSH